MIGERSRQGEARRRTRQLAGGFAAYGRASGGRAASRPGSRRNSKLGPAGAGRYARRAYGRLGMLWKRKHVGVQNNLTRIAEMAESRMDRCTQDLEHEGVTSD